MLQTKRIGMISLLTGTVLLILSVYPLFSIFRESWLSSNVNSRYEIKPAIDIFNKHDVAKELKSKNILASPFEWEGNVIEVITKDTGKDSPKSNVKFRKEKHIMLVTIKINGKEVTEPTQAWLPPKIEEDSDYLSMLNVVIVSDKKTSKQKLIIVQNLVEDWNGWQIESQKWRLMYVNKDKTIEEETFSYPERSEHLLGVKLVQISSQASTFIGYTTNYYLPNIFYPLLYPLFTSLLGFILLIVGAIWYKKVT
ncbi:hypothetical protein [Paenibacillus sp. 32352]|uniref:hypothetical protein n=1 Tax=Paenibacillus sp. 32352 TaxID=1969111 RepID=UPI0009AC3C9E|nr:hypothetical protein [Paenibacillus sp. 32352]